MDRQKLVESASMSCCICRSLLREITNLEEREKEKEKEKEKERERIGLETNPDTFGHPEEQIAGTSQGIESTTLETNKPDIEQKSPTQEAFLAIISLLQVLISSFWRLPERNHDEKFQQAEPTTVNDDNSELEENLGILKNHSILEKPKSLVTAYLSQINDKNYRLDFKWRVTENVGTFILQKTGKSSHSMVI
jgi:hypothetical protein